MTAVISKIAVGQQHGMPARTDRQFPPVGDSAVDINQVNVSVISLRRKERVAASRTLMVDGNETASPAAGGNLVDFIVFLWRGGVCRGGRHGKHTGECRAEESSAPGVRRLMSGHLSTLLNQNFIDQDDDCLFIIELVPYQPFFSYCNFEMTSTFC